MHLCVWHAVFKAPAVSALKGKVHSVPILILLSLDIACTILLIVIGIIISGEE